MRYRYSDEVVPPGLIVPITVDGLGFEVGVSGPARLDTGANLSVMPARTRRALGLRPGGIVRVKGAFDRAPRSEPTYFVRITLDGRRSFELEVVATNRDVFLIGRDVLNELVLHADGPARSFELNL